MFCANDHFSAYKSTHSIKIAHLLSSWVKYTVARDQITQMKCFHISLPSIRSAFFLLKKISPKTSKDFRADAKSLTFCNSCSKKELVGDFYFSPFLRITNSLASSASHSLVPIYSSASHSLAQLHFELSRLHRYSPQLGVPSSF